MNSKLEPKKVLLEKFRNSKEKSFLSNEAQGKNSEKYFFYKADLRRD